MSSKLEIAVKKLQETLNSLSEEEFNQMIEDIKATKTEEYDLTMEEFVEILASWKNNTILRENHVYYTGKQ